MGDSKNKQNSVPARVPVPVPAPAPVLPVPVPLPSELCKKQMQLADANLQQSILAAQAKYDLACAAARQLIADAL